MSIVVISGMLFFWIVVCSIHVTVGGLVRWQWDQQYGPERTPWARTLAVMGPILVPAVGFALQIAWSGPTGAGDALLTWTRRMIVVTVLFGIPAIFAQWVVLAPRMSHGSREPDMQRDHEGITVALSSRRAGGMVVASWLSAWLIPFPVAWLVGAVVTRIQATVTLTIQRTSLRIVDRWGKRTVLPLVGLRVTPKVRWDGTPVLGLTTADGATWVDVGGHDPTEVAWVVDALTQAADDAQPVEPVADPPEALQTMLQAAQGAPSRQHGPEERA